MRGIPSTDIDISAGTVEFIVDVAPKYSDEEYDDREGEGYVLFEPPDVVPNDSNASADEKREAEE